MSIYETIIFSILIGVMIFFAAAIVYGPEKICTTIGFFLGNRIQLGG